LGFKASGMFFPRQNGVRGWCAAQGLLPTGEQRATNGPRTGHQPITDQLSARRDLRQKLHKIRRDAGTGYPATVSQVHGTAFAQGL